MTLIKLKEEEQNETKRFIFRKPTTRREVIPQYQKAIEGMKCYEEVKERILSGWSPGKIADFVVENHAEDFASLATTRDGLLDWLVLYRKKLSPAELVSLRMPRELERAKERLEAGVDVLSEIETLYSMQKERIEIDFGIEKKLKKLFKNTGNEIAIAANLLKDVVALRAELGLDNGEMNGREVREQLITDYATRYGRTEVNKVLADRESVSKVLSVVEDVFTYMKTDDAVNMLKEAVANANGNGNGEQKIEKSNDKE
jgi:hypothetical protein